MPFVKRDHRLLLATHELNDIFGPLMRPTDGVRPNEFAATPIQFPLEIKDTRGGGSRAEARLAPNGDYFIDTLQLHRDLRTVQGDFARIANGPGSEFNKQRAVGKVIGHAFSAGIFTYAPNQAAISAEAYVNAHRQEDFAEPALVTNNR